MPAPRAAASFVASHAQIGGAEGYLDSLLGALDRAWIGEVVVLGEGPFVKRLEDEGVSVRVVRCGRRAGLIAGALRLRRILDVHRPALVHANGVKAALVSVLATWRRDIPVLWHKHDSARDGRLGRFIARRCALVVGVSESSVSTLRGVEGVDTTVVHNGIPPYEVDRESARERLLEETGAAPDSALVGMVGRIHPSKGHLALVEICAELRDRLPAMHVVIGGAADQFEPDYEHEVRKRAAELGVADRVSLLGYRDDAVQITAGCDLLAMPSTPDPSSGWREGFPLAPMEAMAVGTPVAAYAEPGIAEVLGSCGELVPTGDREALREAIARLLEDPAEGERLRACGRERIREFRLPEAARRMERVYAEVAGARSDPAGVAVPVGS